MSAGCVRCGMYAESLLNALACTRVLAEPRVCVTSPSRFPPFTKTLSDPDWQEILDTFFLLFGFDGSYGAWYCAKVAQANQPDSLLPDVYRLNFERFLAEPDVYRL